MVVVVPGLAGERRLRRRHQVVLVVDREVEVEAVGGAWWPRGHARGPLGLLAVDGAAVGKVRHVAAVDLVVVYGWNKMKLSKQGATDCK